MIQLEPIGVARTPLQRSQEIPREGAGPAYVDVFEPFVPALGGIERSSHVWVLGWFESAQRVVTARTRKAAPNEPMRGVLGMRSPARPNPIGLTAARLLRRDGARLALDRLDFFDGTPIIDIKPYSPGWDLIPCATSSHRYDPSRYRASELSAAIQRAAEHALGADVATCPAALLIVQCLVELVMMASVDIRSSDVTFELPAAEIGSELLLCATGATFANGRLRVRALSPEIVLVASSPDGRVWELIRDAASGARIRV